MNPQHLLLPLIQQLELLTKAVNESPYISREERLYVSKEIAILSHQLDSGSASLPHVETSITQLNKRAAADEIVNLTCKIRQLNPTSPRLENLNSLCTQLQSDQISPEQARQKLQELMH